MQLLNSLALAVFNAFMDLGITSDALIFGVVGQYWGYETMFAIGGVIVVLGIMLPVFLIVGKWARTLIACHF